MAHNQKVVLKADGKRTGITCDDVKEGANGITLIDTEGINSKIGYVPYDNLLYVRPNTE